MVVGILVAFALENWNDTRKENEIERDLLEQFREDLRSDIESINFANYWYGKTIFSCEVLVDQLKNRKPFHDSLHMSYKVHLERIEPILWRESAMPNDYNALFEDQVFINHVQWIKNAAMFNKAGNQELIGEIYSLLGFIDQELKK